MQPETYRMLAAREDTYWWHVARREMSVRLLRSCGVSPGGRWLDLGCGPGGNLTLPAMFDAITAIALDLSPLALSLARNKQPRARLVRADLNNRLPLRDAAFDVVTVFNVLYHDWVKNEAAVIAEIHRLLRPGGVALITEPAFSVLAREMDVAAMGHRRYRIADIERMCEAAGLRVERASYFTSFGFPLLLGMKLIQRLKRLMLVKQSKQSADMEAINPIANSLLLGAARLESRAIAAKFTIPCGTTLLCVARKT